MRFWFEAGRFVVHAHNLPAVFVELQAAIARLTWRSVNFETNEIAFTAKRTGRRIVLPLMQPLVDYLSALPSSDNPNAHIFPNAAGVKNVAVLSNQFDDILEDAGLAESRKRRRVKRSVRARESSEISFHSLRHSAVTMLKASGLSDVFAREIVGHEKRGSVTSLHASEHGRSAQRDAALAGRHRVTDRKVIALT